MYLSVAEIKAKYNKSESSIRRIIKELKDKDITQLQFETLSNGVDKILVNSEYLDKHFNKQKNNINTSTSSNTSSEIVQYLLNELEQKNKQIDQLHHLMGNLQNRVLEIEAPKKKRWFSRSK
jgi:hypothetical protein